MKGLLKVIAITAIASMVLTAVASATSSERTAAIDFEAFTAAEEEDPFHMNAPVILGKMDAKEFTGSDGVLKYRIYKSPAYLAKDADTPALMLVFLHGSGGSGDDNEQQIKDQLTMVNYLVSNLGDELFKDIPFMVIAPQCPVGSQWVQTPYAAGSYSLDEIAISKPLQLVYELITDMQKTEGITTANTVVGGISMGGYGTWDIALRHPEVLGAIIPICGAGDPSKAAVIKDKRIWAFHGDKDISVPVTGSRDMDEALKAAGATDYRYTEFAGVGHNAWTPAMTQVKDPYLLQWFFDTRTCSIITEIEGEGTVKGNVTAVKIGSTVKLEFSPKEGYTPTLFYIDGKLSPAIIDSDGCARLELKDVNENHTIKAVFEKIGEESSAESTDVSLDESFVESLDESLEESIVESSEESSVESMVESSEESSEESSKESSEESSEESSAVTDGGNKKISMSKGVKLALIGGAIAAVAAIVGVIIVKKKKK